MMKLSLHVMIYAYVTCMCQINKGCMWLSTARLIAVLFPGCCWTSSAFHKEFMGHVATVQVTTGEYRSAWCDELYYLKQPVPDLSNTCNAFTNTLGFYGSKEKCTGLRCQLLAHKQLHLSMIRHNSTFYSIRSFPQLHSITYPLNLPSALRRPQAIHSSTASKTKSPRFVSRGANHHINPMETPEAYSAVLPQQAHRHSRQTGH